MLTSKAQAALRKIRADIDDHWIQGSYNGGLLNENHCIVGFVHAYTDTSIEQVEVKTALQRALGDPDLISWNDSPWRTKDEVKRLIDDALTGRRSSIETPYV